MVDDEWHRQALEKTIELGQIHGVKMQIQMPLQRLDSLQHMAKLIHVRQSAQVLDEIESHTAKTRVVQALEITIGK